MVNPEWRAPGDAEAVGPVAAGPTAVPPEPYPTMYDICRQLMRAMRRGIMAQPTDVTPFGGPVQYIDIAIDAYGRYLHRRATAEEIEHIRERQRRAELEEQERVRERQDRQLLAERRSRELLFRVLTDEQQAMFDTKEYFDVTGKSGRIYRIDCRGGYSGNVYWMGGGDDILARCRYQFPPGVEIRGSFCVYPRYRPNVYPIQRLPRHDAFLGQLLLIITDEDRFIEVGIFRGPVHPVRGRLGREGYYQ